MWKGISVCRCVIPISSTCFRGTDLWPNTAGHWSRARTMWGPAVWTESDHTLHLWLISSSLSQKHQWYHLIPRGGARFIDLNLFWVNAAYSRVHKMALIVRKVVVKMGITSFYDHWALANRDSMIGCRPPRECGQSLSSAISMESAGPGLHEEMSRLHTNWKVVELEPFWIGTKRLNLMANMSTVCFLLVDTVFLVGICLKLWSLPFCGVFHMFWVSVCSGNLEVKCTV